MKKYIIIGVCVIAFIALGVIGMIHINNDNHYLLNFLKQDTGVYKECVVPDEKSAEEIATAIFNNMEKSKDREHHTATCVEFDEAHNIWFVTFADGDLQTAGGDCTIALRKKDGKVIKILFGE